MPGKTAAKRKADYTEHEMFEQMMSTQRTMFASVPTLKLFEYKVRIRF